MADEISSRGLYNDEMPRLGWVLIVAACSEPAGLERPAPLAALPPPAPVSTDRFLDAESCAQCHLAPDDSPALHDATAANVSPVLLWRSSMMALAARDPYYLSIFAEERARAPTQRATIDALCTRCHGPAGSEERDQGGLHLGFDDLVAGDDAASRLGRSGVTCTACHQIDPANLGDESSFSGGFSIGYQRAIYGPYLDPLTSPMHLIVNYTPTYGNHIGASALCATCHTVIVPTASGSVVEQATYLEWRSSSFRDTKPCQTCHVAVTDAVGTPIATARTIAFCLPGSRRRRSTGRVRLLPALSPTRASSRAATRSRSRSRTCRPARRSRSICAFRRCGPRSSTRSRPRRHRRGRGSSTSHGPGPTSPSSWRTRNKRFRDALAAGAHRGLDLLDLAK